MDEFNLFWRTLKGLLARPKGSFCVHQNALGGTNLPIAPSVLISHLHGLAQLMILGLAQYLHQVYGRILRM